MLLLTFRAAESLYAVDVARVVEVVPRVNLRRLPHAPAFIAGLFDYRGTVVPVIDLGTLLGSEKCRNQLSTRIVLVDSRPGGHTRRGQPEKARQADLPEKQDGTATPERDERGETRRWLLGLIAEQVSDVVSIKPEQVISSAMQLPQAPYLGSIVEIDQVMAQLIVIDRLLDESLREAFFEDGSDEDQRMHPEGGSKVGSA
jgi:chemotaxis-related protein WspB